MSRMVLVRAEDGRLAGLGEKNRRGYEKFKRVISGLEVGETLAFEYRLPRSPNHHKFFFKKLTSLFDRQERFGDFERLLDWLKVGAGWADLLPGQDGIPVAIPKSIAWDNLDEQDFIEFHRAMNDFLWTEPAQAALWPHLQAGKRYVCIDQWHRDFEPSDRVPSTALSNQAGAAR